MMKAIKNKLNQKGFSLIELMVVIVIMLILAAIAIPAFLGVIDDSRQSAATSEVRAVLMLAQLEVNKGERLDDSDVLEAIVTEAGVKADYDDSYYVFTVDQVVNSNGNTVSTAVITYTNSDSGVKVILPETFDPDSEDYGGSAPSGYASADS